MIPSNAAVIQLVTSIKSQPRTRHLNKSRNFITQEVVSGSIYVDNVLGTLNVADLLTKALEQALLTKHWTTLLGTSLRD